MFLGCLYDKIPGIALGQVQNGSPPSMGEDLRLCFNCGSPDHAVASCPAPIDRQLVSLSRQLFNFLHPDSTRQEITRLYVAEGKKQQRLEWLKSYEPGVIRGPLLRDALGLQEGDPGNAVNWLRNMAYWGYPPGWVGRRDPRQFILSCILEDEMVEWVDDTEWDPFAIFEGADGDEKMNLGMFSLQYPSMSLQLPTVSSPTASLNEELEPTRWAIYPDTYFSSTTLPVYSGTPLDRFKASSPLRVSATFTPERRALWEHILSDGLGRDRALLPPSSAFGNPTCLLAQTVVEDFFTPPPPSTTPPPLPLAPNSPVYASASQKFLGPGKESTHFFASEGTGDATDNRSVIDMDMSDDSE